MVGEVINLESKYAKLEKNINLERIHNAYLKATCMQKRAKQIQLVAFAFCEQDDALFRECNRNVEMGLVFDGHIDSESETCAKESSSSSTD